MNEGTKTGIFWGVAVAMLAIAMIVAWPPTPENNGGIDINQPLFKEFKDPLSAASMKIVTFDEEQGQLETFEVRKDLETGAWTIPSRQGYPADAVEQMKDAANALVDLKILDVQTTNAEDHDDLGVAEPALEELEIGDEGVGRLVTLKDDSQKTLASLIIGDPVKDSAGQLYVRKPGQDPVYVVKLDDKPITTTFQKWIEEDLLQLSSIDIEKMEVKDYNAALNPGGQFSLTRNYTADVVMDGSQWKLERLLEFDPEKPLADPKNVVVGADEKLNSTKLNEIKNGLDDLKIVNVVRKPEGMSANLRANKALAADNKAVASLASRGFYPVQMGADGDHEVLAANGELTIGLKDGVQYVLRFGNIAGLSEEEESSDDATEESKSGVNRYLLLMTRVDMSKFPAPDLKPIPKTLEELDALMGKGKADEKGSEAAESKPKDEPVSEKDKPASEKKDTKSADDEPDADEPDADKPDADKPSSDKPDDGEAKPKDEPAADAAESSESNDADAKDASDPADEPGQADEPDSAGEPEKADQAGESEASGNGEASGTGQGQDPDDDDKETTEPADDADAKQAKPETTEETSADETPAKETKTEDAPAKAEPAGDKEAEPASDKSDKEAEPAGDKDDELSDEEKQELLEAEQEKITKENQRLMDERKDKLEAATKRVKDLNARFADWYYVIPEATYSKLRISRDDLFEKPAAANPPGGFTPPGAPPQFQLPGAPR